jgi:hypothetical protein
MFDLLESGYRMVPPDDCPDTLYKVIVCVCVSDTPVTV